MSISHVNVYFFLVLLLCVAKVKTKNCEIETKTETMLAINLEVLTCLAYLIRVRLVKAFWLSFLFCFVVVSFFDFPS